MAGIADRIYRQSPVLLQHLIVSAYGVWWKHLRFGGAFAAESGAFRARERFTREQWQSYQDERLRGLLASAFERVPHYNLQWQALGISGADLAHFSRTDFLELPPLEKSTARDAPDSRY